MKNNYKIQDGCWNCANVFIREEYDESNHYFCNEDKSKRPLCCSVAMNESCIGESMEVFRKSYEAWDEWSKDREVSFSGICNKYKQ